MEDQEGNDLSSVVARADALMQRRRLPPTEVEDVPLLTEVVDPDADLPVLVAEEPSPPAPAQTEPPRLDPAALDILAHELARRLGERLAAEIPDLVATALQSTLGGLTEELRWGLEKTTEDALRDFLAERERLAKLQQQR
ncbi:MAG: hypothetical protein H6R10_156 [Rhodocyclaceae bacterium]|nr:hypothetical protein [Rhodocyclaceae bacterium]